MRALLEYLLAAVAVLAAFEAFGWQGGRGA